MQVCVTGASGFIGRHLIEALYREGHAVRVLTRRMEAAFPSQVERVIGDLREDDCPLGEFLKDCDQLFHCAGAISDETSMHALHVEGTKRLIKAALAESRLQDKKIHWVQLSSCGAYGPPPMRQPHIARKVLESTANNPVNEYEKTKTLSDSLLMEACQHAPLSFSILRPSNVIGAQMPNQSLRKLIHLVKGRKFFYLGKKGAIATYVHVEDVVNALLLLGKHPLAQGQIYNLSSDCPLEALINTIASIAEVPQPRLRLPAVCLLGPVNFLQALLKKWIKLPNLNVLVYRTTYPSNKISEALGFKLQKPLPEAVEDLMRSMRADED